MKRVFKIVAFLGVAVVAIVVAGVAILSTQDFNSYRDLIAEQAEAATGRKLTIAGNLELELSLTPAISVEGVTFANAPWGSRPDMVTMEKLAARVELIPLLSGDIRVEWLELSGVDVLLETDKQGTGNWAFSSGSEEAAADSGAAAGPLPVVKAVRMRDIKLAYVDGATGARQQFQFDRLRLSADGPDKPLSLLAEAVFNDEKINVEGSLGSVEALLENKMFPLNIEIAALGVEGELDGTIKSPRDAKGYNVGFSVKGPSMKAVAARGVALSGGGDVPPLADSAFYVAGAIRDEGDRVAIDGLKLTAGGSDIAGNLSLVPTSPRLDLKAVVTSKKLALSDFLEDSGEDAPASPPAEDGRVFPADPLPFEGLRGVDAAVNLGVQQLNLEGADFQDVAVDLQLKSGKLAVRPFALSYLGNAIEGAVSLDASSNSAPVKVMLAGKGIDYGSLLAATTGDATLSGKLDLNVDVAGKGASVRAIMASLNGDLRVVSQDGRIESGALSFMSGGVLDAVPFLGSGEDSKALKCAVIDFGIKDGIAAPRALVIETGGLNIIGSGAVDLRDEKINLLFDPRAKNTSLVSMAEVGIRVGGTFLSPEFGPDSASVAKNVGKTALGIATGGLSTLAEMAFNAAKNTVDDTDYCQAALSGKMPEAAPASTSEPASNDQPAQQGGGVVEGVGGALDSLFGN